MNDPSMESISDIPAANRSGRQRIAYHGSPAGGAAGEHEQRDLGRGVEPEAEQHPDRVHLLGLPDRLVSRAEDPVHQPAVASCASSAASS